MSVDIASLIVSLAYDICYIITWVAMLSCLLDTVVDEPFQPLLRCSVFEYQIFEEIHDHGQYDSYKDTSIFC